MNRAVKALVRAQEAAAHLPPHLREVGVSLWLDGYRKGRRSVHSSNTMKAYHERRA